jgi:endonuclease/exonuclease/phosphatase family metal-dependent hydrolase
MSKKSKAVYWNIWGHRHADDIHAFLKQHDDADVFCLTEVTDISDREMIRNGHNLIYTGNEAASQVNGYQQLKEQFGADRQIFYDTADYRRQTCIQTGAKFNKMGFGSALLIKNDVFVIDMGVHKINFNDSDIKDRIIQWVVYQKGNTRYLLAHLHGVWIKGNTKGDHAVRTHQSREVRHLLQSLMIKHTISKVVFGGDLNLNIDTEALKIIQTGERMGDAHFANLVYNYGIKNTRTLAYRNYNADGHSLFADYVFTSKDVHVDSFKVLNDVLASDHAPLIVEFS